MPNNREISRRDALKAVAAAIGGIGSISAAAAANPSPPANGSGMKLGLGLHKHLLTRDNYRFAAQAGCTDIVAHYADYVREPSRPLPPYLQGYKMAGEADKLWTVAELSALKREIESEGLRLAALENVDPAFWSDVLLDGPNKLRQLENLKVLIRRIGEAGIPCLGYDFSLAGVTGRDEGPFARAGARTARMNGADADPLPNGVVWNMIYDPAAPPGHIAPISQDELWRRLEDFLVAVLPVAEESGVTLALHPDDPPTPTLRGTPRLVYQPYLYQKLIDLNPSPRIGLEFCLGSVAEMTGGDIYEAVDRYSREHRITYVHFRNVHGKAPHYTETFVDDGDTDMLRVLRILHRNGFDGVLIPDHAPLMTCGDPWHAGMAFTLGYMRAALQSLKA